VVFPARCSLLTPLVRVDNRADCLFQCLQVKHQEAQSVLMSCMLSKVLEVLEIDDVLVNGVCHRTIAMLSEQPEEQAGANGDNARPVVLALMGVMLSQAKPVGDVLPLQLEEAEKILRVLGVPSAWVRGDAVAGRRMSVMFGNGGGGSGGGGGGGRAGRRLSTAVEDGWGYGWAGRKTAGAKPNVKPQSVAARARARADAAHLDVKAGKITFKEFKAVTAAAAADEAKALLRQGLITFAEYKLRVAAGKVGVPKQGAGAPGGGWYDKSSPPKEGQARSAAKITPAGRGRARGGAVAKAAGRTPPNKVVPAPPAVKEKERTWADRERERDRSFIARALDNAGITDRAHGDAQLPSAADERARAQERAVDNLINEELGYTKAQSNPTQGNLGAGGAGARRASRLADGWGYSYGLSGLGDAQAGITAAATAAARSASGKVTKVPPAPAPAPANVRARPSANPTAAGVGAQPGAHVDTGRRGSAILQPMKQVEPVAWD
jgi:hypothetical protein